MGKRTQPTNFAGLVTANALLDLETYDGIVADVASANSNTRELLRRSWFELQRVSLLGQGVYSNVHLVVDPETKLQYALKCLDPKRLSTTGTGTGGSHDSHEFLDAAKDLARETALLTKLDHENIIPIRGFCSKSLSESYQEDGNGFFFFMDVLQETLKDRLDRWRGDKDMYQPKNRLDPRRFLFKHSSLDLDRLHGRLETVALGIVRGMRYLHEEQSIVLRDLKPANVGFDATTGQVRLFDFGLSRSIEECLPDEVVGTPRYMAPEVMVNQGTSYASDVYSFGVLLYEIATLKVAFSKQRSLEDFQKHVVDARARPNLNGIPCLLLCSLISECWAHDRRQRPSFREIQNRLLGILEPPPLADKPTPTDQGVRKLSSLEVTTKTFPIVDHTDSSLFLEDDESRDSRDSHTTGSSCNSTSNTAPSSLLNHEAH